MAESKDFSAEAGSAKVVGTVSSTDIAEPITPPTGLRAIGPRITFHFVDEWDAETSYVLYDVVRVNGTSYIANKINIAKGINPETDNNVHWIKWNDPNSQVELLQSTVNRFDGRITEAMTTATNAAGDAAEAKKTSADNATAISAETTRAKEAEGANASSIAALRAKAARTYASTTAMQTDSDLKSGMIVQTVGFHDNSQFGGGIYKITADGTANAMDVIALQNDLFAKLVMLDGKVNPEQLGAIGDGVNDDTSFLKRAFEISKNIELLQKYVISATLSFANGTKIVGNCGYPAQLIAAETLNGFILKNESKQSSFIIENVWFRHLNPVDGAPLNSAGGLYIDNPYDECVIRNCVFDNLGGVSLKIGNNIDTLGQTLLVDNCLFYGTHANPVNPMAVFTRMYEMNLLNTKFLQRVSAPTVPAVKLVKCWDANIQGCSFGNAAVAPIKCTNGLRYSRIIANTFENVSSETFIDFGDANETATDDTAYVSNIVIATNYYNSPNKVGIYHQYYNGNNVFIGCYATNGSGNFSIAPGKHNFKEPIQNTGPNALVTNSLTESGMINNAQKIGLTTNAASKITYMLRDNSTESADYGIDLLKYKNSEDSTKLATINDGMLAISGNGSGLVLYDSNGGLHKITVSTSGSLVVS